MSTELRDLAVTIGREAADLARDMRAEAVVADTKSSAVDIVTQADRAVEELIRARLRTLRPDDAVLGEEEGRSEGTSGVRWIVDPIDGTVNYLYGLPDCAVSIAAEVDGDLVAGAVVGIGLPVVYAAAAGAGATRDGRSIHVREPVTPDQFLVLTGFGYRSEVRAHQAARVARLLPAVRDIRRMGSCAMDLCRVAEGAADAYVEEGPQPWDWAAGSVVLREAGGRFEVLEGTLHQAVPEAPGRALLAGSGAGIWPSFLDRLGAAGFTPAGGE